MSLRRKRRRKREQRRHHETQPTRRSGPAHDVREVAVAAASSDWALGAKGELEGLGGARSASAEDSRDATRAPVVVQYPSPALREADEVRRLAYTRRQAAEALGVSISTIDRRVVSAVDSVITPWGQRLIPVEELERFMRDNLEPARGRPARRPAGRPPKLPRSVVDRIRLEYARGRGLSEIARTLNAEGVPTAHSGLKWWPSTVRAILVRSIPPVTVSTT